MEEWKPIAEHPGYEVSSLGRVRYIELLPIWKDHQGYNKVTISKKQMRVARIVGETFIPNPDNKPHIDHINRNRGNDSVENLRWATPSENNYNRDQKLSQSGHRYIYMTPEGYFRVTVRRPGRECRKTYKTLEEAIQARDSFLASL